jgi:hypothetical protein
MTFTNYKKAIVKLLKVLAIAVSISRVCLVSKISNVKLLMYCHIPEDL